jgi:hypothetical protein
MYVANTFKKQSSKHIVLDFTAISYCIETPKDSTPAKLLYQQTSNLVIVPRITCWTNNQRLRTVEVAIIFSIRTYNIPLTWYTTFGFSVFLKLDWKEKKRVWSKLSPLC